jgi:hypothetical protein
MVQQRRALDGPLLRRPHRPALPPNRQHARRQQSPPALHLETLLRTPGSRRAEYIVLGLRHPHLPFAAAAQLPWFVVAGCAEG